MLVPRGVVVIVSIPQASVLAGNEATKGYPCDSRR